MLDVNDDSILEECGVKNKIHRLKMYQSIRVERGEFPLISDSVDSATPDKHLDVFISYRRNNGSQLASLLKVFLDNISSRWMSAIEHAH